MNLTSEQLRARTDTFLKDSVLEELEWAPGVNATHIGVSVVDGAVTLSGEVGTYPEKHLAERAVERVRGVRALAEEITVRAALGAATDTSIAREAATALDRAVDLSGLALTATVEDHEVTLRGTVPWHHQSESAERCVRYIKGVRDVQNEIRVVPQVSTTDIRTRMEAALVRQALADASGCGISVDSAGAVTLTGAVGTWAERAHIGRIARATAGVTSVRNELAVVD